jgi:hypothetical protein
LFNPFHNLNQCGSGSNFSDAHETKRAKAVTPDYVRAAHARFISARDLLSKAEAEQEIATIAEAAQEIVELEEAMRKKASEKRSDNRRRQKARDLEKQQSEAEVAEAADGSWADRVSGPSPTDR